MVKRRRDTFCFFVELLLISFDKINENKKQNEINDFYQDTVAKTKP
jgi:hypothetical protein